MGKDGPLLELRLGVVLWSFHLLALGSLVLAVGLNSSSSIGFERSLSDSRIDEFLHMYVFQRSFKSRVYLTLSFRV